MTSNKKQKSPYRLAVEEHAERMDAAAARMRNDLQALRADARAILQGGREPPPHVKYAFKAPVEFQEVLDGVTTAFPHYFTSSGNLNQSGAVRAALELALSYANGTTDLHREVATLRRQLDAVREVVADDVDDALAGRNPVRLHTRTHSGLPRVHETERA